VSRPAVPILDDYGATMGKKKGQSKFEQILQWAKEQEKRKRAKTKHGYLLILLLFAAGVLKRPKAAAFALNHF